MPQYTKDEQEQVDLSKKLNNITRDIVGEDMVGFPRERRKGSELWTYFFVGKKANPESGLNALCKTTGPDFEVPNQRGFIDREILVFSSQNIIAVNDSEFMDMANDLKSEYISFTKSNWAIKKEYQ